MLENQPSIIRIASLTAQGVGRREIASTVRGLHRLTVGAYADTSDLTVLDFVRLRCHALLVRVGDSVPSHRTATTLWGHPHRPVDLTSIDLSALQGRIGHAKSGPGYRFHRREVGPEDLTQIAGLPVTTPLRTVLDNARMRDTDWAVVIADAALHRGLVSTASLQHAAASMSAAWGVARARSVARLSSPLAESPGESLLRMRLLRMDVAVEEQVVLEDVVDRPRVDFVVGGTRLVIEFDGESKYEIGGDPARAHWLEKQRHDRIVEAGYEVLRVTWAELWDEPTLRRRVSAALRRAELRGLPHAN